MKLISSTSPLGEVGAAMEATAGAVGEPEGAEGGVADEERESLEVARHHAEAAEDQQLDERQHLLMIMIWIVSISKTAHAFASTYNHGLHIVLDDDPPPPPPRGRVTKKTPVSALASAPRPPAPASATSTARTPAASTSTLPSGAFTSAGNTQAAIGSEKRCECGAGSGNQAVQRAVVKEGANKGRLFWTCAKDRDAQCGFWEWADDGAGAGGAGAGGNHNGRTSGTGTSSGECFKVSNSLGARIVGFLTGSRK